MNKLCIHAVISGKVQGVFFRSNAEHKAQQLGITGWVKNLPTGEVELFACGERDPVMLLTEWLWEGPPNAEVSNVHWDEKPWQKLDAFKAL